MPATATFAPSAARDLAIARPNPPPPPSTSAVFPLSPKSIQNSSPQNNTWRGDVCEVSPYQKVRWQGWNSEMLKTILLT
jgi:hypothetical protein